jgi:hypothetical protein
MKCIWALRTHHPTNRSKGQHLEQVKAFDSISKTKQTNKYDLKLPINTSYAEFAPVEYGKQCPDLSFKKSLWPTEQPFLSLYSTRK